MQSEEMAMQYQRGYIDGFKDGRAKFEPKTGQWIVDRSFLPFTYTCGICGRNVFDYYVYCPYCGARMYEPQERNDKE